MAVVVILPTHGAAHANVDGRRRKCHVVDDDGAEGRSTCDHLDGPRHPLMDATEVWKRALLVENVLEDSRVLLEVPTVEERCAVSGHPVQKDWSVMDLFAERRPRPIAEHELAQILAHVVLTDSGESGSIVVSRTTPKPMSAAVVMTPRPWSATVTVSAAVTVTTAVTVSAVIMPVAMSATMIMSAAMIMPVAVMPPSRSNRWHAARRLDVFRQHDDAAEQPGVHAVHRARMVIVKGPATDVLFLYVENVGPALPGTDFVGAASIRALRTEWI